MKWYGHMRREEEHVLRRMTDAPELLKRREEVRQPGGKARVINNVESVWL